MPFTFYGMTLNINEVADSLGRLRPDERAEIERVLKQIDEEEARVLRLYAAGMVTEENWKHLWQEWEDKRNKLKANLERLDQTCETYIESLPRADTYFKSGDTGRNTTAQ